MESEDTKWAAEYILDPVNAPNPSEETGLNAHFDTIGRTPTPVKTKVQPTVQVKEQSAGGPGNTNPFRRSSQQSKTTSSSVHQRHSSAPIENGNTIPARSASSGSNKPFHGASHRDQLASNLNEGRMRRASSLSSRYPGDRSHRPLAILTAEARAAHRAPHLTKRYLPGADTIDHLDDTIAAAYHHEGPYDAALLARNINFRHSPVAAVEWTNREALRATPQESIRDAVERHRPLDNTAIVPPGMPDKFGRIMHYEEGSNMQIENGGDYKRWPGVEYRKGDVKGHGEPGWDAGAWGRSGMKSEDEYRMGGGKHGDGQDETDVELVEHPGRKSLDREGEKRAEYESAGKRMSGELRKRIGSLRRKKVDA